VRRTHSDLATDHVIPNGAQHSEESLCAIPCLLRDESALLFVVSHASRDGYIIELGQYSPAAIAAFAKSASS
jgi:hypothetical protein